MKIEVSISTGEALPIEFVFHHDAAHGWLAVPFSSIEALALERQISRYSYHKDGMIYLEEDLDAVIFIRAYLKKVGEPGNFKYFNQLCTEVYDGYRSEIWNYQSYDRKSTRPVIRV